MNKTLLHLFGYIAMMCGLILVFYLEPVVVGCALGLLFIGVGGLAFYAIIANFCVRQIIKHSRRLISEKKNEV